MLTKLILYTLINDHKWVSLGIFKNGFIKTWNFSSGGYLCQSLAYIKGPLHVFLSITKQLFL